MQNLRLNDRFLVVATILVIFGVMSRLGECRGNSEATYLRVYVFFRGLPYVQNVQLDDHLL